MTGFSKNQQEFLHQMMSRSVQDAISQALAQQATQQSGSGHGQATEPSRDNRTAVEPTINMIKNNGQSTFKPEVVGYFHSDLSSMYGKDDIAYNGKETIYRDVHAFVDRLNDMLIICGAPTIRTNLV